MNSNSFSTSPGILIQTHQFYLPSNSFPQYQPPPHVNISSISRNKRPSISIRKPPNLPPTAAGATGGFYTTVVPSEEEETLYELLGISQNVTLSDIKRAYKQMALRYHPDVSPSGQVEEYTMRFIRVQEAYETLSDPESRAAYDCNLAKGLSVNKGRWRETWEGQVAELKRRRTVEMGGRMSWAARIRKQRAGSDVDQ